MLRSIQGANYYPENMTKDDFNEWINSIEDEDVKEKAKSYTYVIKNTNKEGKEKFTIHPYNEEYFSLVKDIAIILQQAAEETTIASLKSFLMNRSQSFLNNDYNSSEAEWISLDSPIEIAIGPYLAYKDLIFGYKASYQLFLGIRDDAETKKLVTSFILV